MRRKNNTWCWVGIVFVLLVILCTVGCEPPVRDGAVLVKEGPEKRVTWVPVNSPVNQYKCFMHIRSGSDRGYESAVCFPERYVR